MPLRNTDISETVRRLRKHPVICMDGQNITSDAANEIERLQAELYEEKNTIRILTPAAAEAGKPASDNCDGGRNG